jgi:ATP-dependent helicase/nuclease subunit A
MRERIIRQLRSDAPHSATLQAQWADLRNRIGEIQISTVDAFCLSLLREFPLEADLDPGFGMADETEVPRLTEEAAERALAIGSTLAGRDAGVAMLLAQLGPWRARVALTALLNRRLVVPVALHRFLAGAPRGLTGEGAGHQAVKQIAARVATMGSQVAQLLTSDALADPRSAILARDLERLPDLEGAAAAVVRAWLDRMRGFFLTQKGTPRSVFGPPAGASGPARRRYREAAVALAPLVRDVLRGFDRDINLVMARGVQVLFGVAVSEYRRALESRALLDFSEVLRRAVDLLRQMDEFSQSRYRLESRYHHVLVDEFQDTSRAQWELISLLVQSWGEGSGLVHESPVPPTIFVVGDRKQSIYRFRDADVSVLEDAAGEIAALRADGDVGRSISHSFRAVPALLAFLNDLFSEVPRAPGRRDGFRFEAQDRFPVDPSIPEDVRSQPGDDALGLVVEDDVEMCAEAVAAEVAHLLEHGEVRSRDRSGHRRVRPQDVAILFRTRESHREFEHALERLAIPTYVYKGLGFFDADEIKDARALIRFLANPWSELRAAALLRSRFVRLSDPALLTLAGQLSRALLAAEPPAAVGQLGNDDRRVLEQARVSLVEWGALIDRLPPAELLDRVLHDGAYAAELQGPRVIQARENLKKIRGLVRRLQNRGYATMARVADYIDHLSGDISNAVIEAFDAVNLMTVHAAKGLEFPIVFLVDLGRGTGMQPSPVRVIADGGDGRPSVAIWPYRTEVDEDERRRDLEETKRLLYVATTRARDRLYLSTVLDEGRVKFSRGSFGETLPPRFSPLFEAAERTPTAQPVTWQAGSGAVHSFRVCGITPSVPDDRPPPVRATPAILPGVALDPVISHPHLVRLPVTAAAPPRDRSRRVGKHDGDADPIRERTIGHLVHLLTQQCAVRPVADQELAQQTRRLASTRLGQLDAAPDVVDAAVSLYVRLRSHAAVMALAEQACLFEVPFSHLDRSSSSRPAGRDAVLWRGTIDCLARAPDGRITVLEFKTGGAEPEHERQIELCVAAARAMFPNATVEGRLVYA